MAANMLEDLKPLLDQFDRPGHMLSCYADLAGADGCGPNWQEPFAREVVAIHKELPEHEPARPVIERDLAAIRKELESPSAPGHRWRAVFSAAGRGFFLAIPLDTPVSPTLICNGSPYLAPLLAATLRRRQYLAVHSDSHRARLYVATPGSVRRLDDVEGEVPRKQHSAGETWGLSQSTFAHHRDEAIHHLVKALVAMIEKAWAAHRFAGLLLFGQHPMLEHVRKALPPRIARRVERETPEAWSDHESEVEGAIRETALRVFHQDEARELDGLWDRLAAQAAVAMGPAAVLDALNSGQIQPKGHGYLALGPDERETVGRCTKCALLAVDAPATCPRCKAPCRLGNLWEEVMLTALRHDIAVHFVDDAERLAPYGGIVAALAKNVPAATTRGRTLVAAKT